eukprot:symbB.v1.2.037420.t1/scaffold5520.1/size26209/3
MGTKPDKLELRRRSGGFFLDSTQQVYLWQRLVSPVIGTKIPRTGIGAVVKAGFQNHSSLRQGLEPW